MTLDGIRGQSFRASVCAFCVALLCSHVAARDTVLFYTACTRTHAVYIETVHVMRFRRGLLCAVSWVGSWGPARNKPVQRVMQDPLMPVIPW